MLNLKQKALLALLQPNSKFDFSVLSAEDWDAVRKESYAQAVPIVAFDGTARCKQYIPKEVYTALDLSFLEAPLTNENLEDKGRFNGGLTVREFLQYLMIFLCYILFGIKVIKKLPGLIGGVSDGVEDFKTVDTYSKNM